jgi:hypothetical protein
MKRGIVVLTAMVLLAAVAACGPSKPPAEMTAALDAVSSLKSKVDASVLYPDYSKTVGDVKGSVDVFLSGTAAKDFPEVAAELKETMDAYVLASQVWKYHPDIDPYPNAGYQPVQNLLVNRDYFPTWDEMMAKYPDMSKGVSNWGDSGQVLSIDKAIQVLWAAASEHLSSAKAAAEKR